MISSNRPTLISVKTFDEIINKPIGDNNYTLLDKYNNYQYKNDIFIGLNNISRHKVVVKIINQKYGNPNRELTILKMLHHPNIIKFDDSYIKNNTLHIVTPYYTGGDVYDDLIIKNYDEFKTKKYINQILSAINYLHKELKICHRDIKIDNLVFKNKKKDESMLGDFGSAKYIKGTFSTIEGTTEYSAPEVFNRCYTELCDMWSLGIVMYTMITGHLPFNTTSPIQIKTVLDSNNLINMYEWKHVSENGKVFIKNLLEIDTQKRLSSERAIYHIWFKQLSG